MIQVPDNQNFGLNVVLSLAALAVAIWSAAIARRTSKRQVLLQERLLSLENVRERDRKVGLQQAALQADLLPSHNNTYSLRIHNDGPGQARSVQVFVDGKPLAESEHISHHGAVISTLGPGAQVKYHVRSFIGMQPIFRVRIEWTDDSSAERNWESDLRI